MWSGIERRIAENDRDGVVPLRRILLAEITASALKPGQSTTKKMVPLETPTGERLVWQIEGTAGNFYLHRKWTNRAEAAGYACKLFPYQPGQTDGARHSALSRDWSFRIADCIQIHIETADSLRELIRLVNHDADSLVLDPAAITRWIGVIRKSFASFQQFDPPDPEFDETERNYKLETARNLRSALDAATSDSEIVAAVLAAIGDKSSNLLDWRTYLPLMPTGDGDKEKLEPALARLARAALASPDGHGAAMDEFVSVWREAVPKPSDDPPRQIAEFLFFHLWPDTASYIRNSVRQDLWREATGRRFPSHGLMSESYADELRFMRAVHAAFSERGLAPRDMIDVQSALWVVSKYQSEGSGMNREEIEGAMDAIDRHREGLEKSELLDRFRDPRDYWVLSTKERPNRIYPSKPIVGYLRRKTELNGGWGQKHDAAAVLHEAGYVIAGENGEALPIPEQYGHLDRGTVHAGKCALNYFIEPYREQGKNLVSIRVGDLCTLMGPSFSSGVASDALSDTGFPTLARAASVERTGQPGTEDEIFSFFLEQAGEREKLKSETKRRAALATNLILYGPPGTGKTYHTAFEAVRLCLGDEFAGTLRNDRTALMDAYRRLVEKGRIEFVTFHQSMSYEEFVEGLRPETGNAQEGIGTGFRLEPVPGIFQRIALKAEARLEEDRETPVQSSALLAHPSAANFSDEQTTQELFKMGKWPEVSDGSYRQMAKDVAIALTQQHPEGFSLQQYRTALIKAGDETGKVPTGGWETHNMPTWVSHPERGWIVPVTEDRDTSAGYATAEEGSDRPGHAAQSGMFDGERNFVLIIDEINRANISKVFGELITLLEPDKRLGMDNEIRLQLPYSKAPFGVPANLHIIGTMNTTDRSIALLDTALRRRFTFRELMPDPSVLPVDVDGINLQRLLMSLNDRIEYLFDREHQIGHAYFTNCQSRSDIEEVMRHKVIPLLAEYFYEDWSRVATVLGDSVNGRNCFLTSRSLPAPDGMGEDETGQTRVRWTVNSQFDFSGFVG